MTSRWEQVESLYHAARARPLDERARFLREACAGDTELERDVRSLLDQHGRSTELVPAEGELLAPGARVGVYRVDAELGAGAMGRVYRAHDTRLGRDVALKVLPPSFAGDADRLARFEREARALAALNHPNVAQIYGLESADGVLVLAMELASGGTLADRIRRGLTVKETIAIARQICEALDAAHEKGIVHRDLKPSNIGVGPDGTVKLLDFGLAKSIQPLAGEAADATATGTIVGTPAYMSPEQARGQPVDKRTDIWAFGCVLYEMVTGRRAFEAPTVSDTFTSVLGREPDWAALPASMGWRLRELSQRCLRKDPRTRLRDIGDARIELQETTEELDGASRLPLDQDRRTRRSLRAVPWIVAGAAVVSLVAFVARFGSRGTASPERLVTRLEVNLPSGVEISTSAEALALSPDGTRVAFIGFRGGNRQVYVRRLDQFLSVPIRGTDSASSVFFSPDSRSIGVIVSNRVLEKVSLGDGLVETLTRDADFQVGAAWTADNRIVFGRGGVLWQVPASGGSPTQLTTRDAEKGEVGHAFPSVVAGGRTILFAVVTGSSRSAVHIEALPLATGRRHFVIEGTRPLYAASGHLIFFRNGAVLAAPFDEDRLQVTGPTVRVIDEVRVGQLGMPLLDVSAAGSVTYLAGTATSQLVLVSRLGVEHAITDTQRPYFQPRFAKDARRVAISMNGDLWIQDTERRTFTKLTSDATTGNDAPVWMPDDTRVVFRTTTGLSWMAADGSGHFETIPDTSANDYPNSVSPDGEWLVFSRISPDTAADLYLLSLHGAPKPHPLVRTKAFEGGAQFSPDGHWIAYSSDESGQFQVFLRQFPGPDRKWLVSQTGKYPRWNPKGKELFYRDGDQMMAIEVVTTTPEPRFSGPRSLFEQRYEFGNLTIPNYDVSPDGQQFVMVKNESGEGRLNIVLNWFEELKRLVPVK